MKVSLLYYVSMIAMKWKPALISPFQDYYLLRLLPPVGWVSVTIEFRFWPKFDPMFPGTTYCFFQSILVIRQSHSAHSWVLSFRYSGGISCFQVLPWHYGRQQKMITSHNHFRIARDLKQKFSSQKGLNICDRCIMKLKGKVLKREYFIV